MGSEGSGEQGSGGRDRQQPSDPIGDFQRWLMRAGARSLGREVADRVRTTINGGRRTSGDVWDIATTEPPPDEAPECAWCPICRAARRYRESGGTAPGGGAVGSLGAQLAGLAQDAFGIFDAALRSAQRPPSRPGAGSGSGTASGGPFTAPSAGGASASASSAGGASASASSASASSANDTGTGWPAAAAESAASTVAGSDDGPVVGASPVLGGTAVHPQDQDGEAANEGSDRDEGGEAGDGPAGDGGDDQVERPAE